jgi:hypothetical protein
LPEIAPASPRAETSALSRAPQTSLLPVAQETPPEPEQVLPLAQEIRHEESTCTQLCYLLLTNHS